MDEYGSKTSDVPARFRPGPGGRRNNKTSSSDLRSSTFFSVSGEDRGGTKGGRTLVRSSKMATRDRAPTVRWLSKATERRKTKNGIRPPSRGREYTKTREDERSAARAETHLSMSWSSVAGNGCTRQCMARGRGGAAEPGCSAPIVESGAQSPERDGGALSPPLRRRPPRERRRRTMRDVRAPSFESDSPRSPQSSSRHRTTTARCPISDFFESLAIDDAKIRPNTSDPDRSDATTFANRQKLR